MPIGYQWIEVESYKATHTGGLHGSIHIRPVAGQGLDTSMRVECPSEMRHRYPVGTRFRVKAKVTNKEGGIPFLYSHHSWRYEVLK